MQRQMRAPSTHFRTALLMPAVLAALLTACRADVRFPTGRVQFTSNGLSVEVDAGGESGDWFAFHGPLVNVQVEE
ncbi:MAG: hypothetical protein GY778_08310 [bacterium]|nr:hypothetical protein [bacterium]